MELKILMAVMVSSSILACAPKGRTKASRPNTIRTQNVQNSTAVFIPAVKTDEPAGMEYSSIPARSPVQEQAPSQPVAVNSLGHQEKIPTQDQARNEQIEAPKIENAPPAQAPAQVPVVAETPAQEPAPEQAPNMQPAVNPPSTSDFSHLEKQLLDLINASRAQGGLQPLTFSREQSTGQSNCMGSAGHSEYMAQRNKLSHDNFPKNICVASQGGAENVGFAEGDESTGVRRVHEDMMNEGPSGGHYQNIMNPKFNAVGIGFFYYRNRLWMTSNFLRL